MAVSSMANAITPFYIDLTQHFIPGPASLSYFIPFILLPGALLIPPSVLSHLALATLFLPPIFASLVHAWMMIGGVDVISISLLLWSTLMLALRDPRVTHRRIWVVDDGEGKTQGSECAAVETKKRHRRVLEEAYPEVLSRRIPWVLTLLVSLRFTGWKIGEPSHDKSQPPAQISRKVFLRHALAIVMSSYLLLDLAASYVLVDPYFTTSGMSVDAPFPIPSPNMHVSLVLFRLLPPRLVRSSVLAAQVYALVTLLFYLGTPVAVALNALGLLPKEWSPHTWPLFLGNFSNIGRSGIRGLWGRWWHRNNRQAVACPGQALAQSLGMKNASTPSFMCVAVSAFFFSGVLHMGLIPPCPKSEALTPLEMRLYVGAFFWAQLPAFAIEITVSRFLMKFAPELPEFGVSNVVVYVWASLWCCLTFPLLTPPFREIGYWTLYPVPISVVQGLSMGRWIAW